MTAKEIKEKAFRESWKRDRRWFFLETLLLLTAWPVFCWALVNLFPKGH